MTQALTLRVPDSDADEIRRIARKERRSVSEIGARIVDEWLRLNRFPDIELRTINDERVACLKGRLEIWQIIMIAQEYGGDEEKIAAHLNLRSEQLQAALSYYSAYPEEIDATLVENQAGLERLERLLPEIQNIGLADEDLAAVTFTNARL